MPETLSWSPYGTTGEIIIAVASLFVRVGSTLCTTDAALPSNDNVVGNGTGTLRIRQPLLHNETKKKPSFLVQNRPQNYKRLIPVKYSKHQENYFYFHNYTIDSIEINTDNTVGAVINQYHVFIIHIWLNNILTILLSVKFRYTWLILEYYQYCMKQYAYQS